MSIVGHSVRSQSENTTVWGAAAGTQKRWTALSLCCDTVTAVGLAIVVNSFEAVVTAGSTTAQIVDCLPPRPPADLCIEPVGAVVDTDPEAEADLFALVGVVRVVPAHLARLHWPLGRIECHCSLSAKAATAVKLLERTASAVSTVLVA